MEDPAKAPLPAPQQTPDPLPPVPPPPSDALPAASVPGSKDESQSTSQTIDDAIRSGNFILAGHKLESYRLEYGETPHFLFYTAKVKLGLKMFGEANELLKGLYYRFPVFMADRPDYENFRVERIIPPMEQARAQWKKILHLLSRQAGEKSEIKPSESAEKQEISIQERDDLKKDLARIADLFRQVLAIEPMHVDALEGLIKCSSELGNLEDLINLKDRLERVPAHWGGLRALRAGNAYNEAKKAYREENLDLSNRIINLGLETVPDDPRLLVLKGEILLKMGKFRESMACIDLVLDKNSNNTEAMRARGKIQAARFDFDFTTAQELLSGAEALEAGSAAQACQAREALSHFVAALDYDPANMLALSGIYRCHVLNNNPLKAHAALARIKELDPCYKVPGPGRKKAVRDEEFLPEPCFVATRIFGPDSPETISLRDFRDRWLLTRWWGRMVADCYRRVGPALARLPGRSFFLGGVRILLGRFARFWESR